MNKLGLPMFALGVIIAACFAALPVRKDGDVSPPPGVRLSQWGGSAGLPFALGLGLIIAGGLLARSGRKEQIRAKRAKGTDPRALLDRIAERLAKLPGGAPESHAAELAAGLDDILEAQVPAFLEHRAALIEEMGLARFAEMIGQFASMERNAARAWSALTDEAWDEVGPCLERAKLGLERAMAAYGGTT